MKVHCFPPVINQQSRVLILGSIPSVESLRRQQYYGNPRNHFWPIIFHLFGVDLLDDYCDRIEFLLSKGLAVWDVLARGERDGSLDANIRHESANDFLTLLAKYPRIKVLAFNGGKAFKSFQKYAAENAIPHLLPVRLPSTSPIPGKNVKSYEEKCLAWSVLLNYL